MHPVKTKKKLSRADKKQIEAAIARANRTDKKGKSAQDSIPYERMWPDGICRVSDSHYTKTIQFQDINYQPVSYTHLDVYKRQIVVHECSYDENGTRRQDIEIYYSFVGKIDLPE